MRSFPCDSAELSQVWQSVLKNLTGLVSSFPNGFDKFNEDPFRVLEKITNPVTSTKECTIAAFIISVVVGTTAVVVMYFLIDCLKKAGTAIPSYARIATNDLEKFPKNSSSSRVISVVAPAILLEHNLEAPDEFSTLERFLKPNEFSSDQLAAYTGNYAIVLSSGSYKVVFKGKLPNGTLVVVKVFTNTDDKKMEEQFMANVSSIEKTHHMNLVRLYGFCFDLTTRALVYEDMENGSLHRFLFGDKMAIDGLKMHEIAVGTMKGIAYLHEECEQRIVHYDTKPENILLD